MKYFITTNLILISFLVLSAQERKPIINSAGFYYSLNGSGDLEGFIISAYRQNSINKNFEIFYGPSMSLHFGRDYSYMFQYAQLPLSIRDTYDPMKFYTFGAQGDIGFAYNTLLNTKFPIRISMSGISRFQSTSYPSTYSFVYDTRALSFPYYVIKDIDPDSFSIGYKMNIGINIGKIYNRNVYLDGFMQNDLRGDLISSIGILMK